MISFVVPAHNEAVCLPQTLQAIHASARALGVPYEVIVVDDASTDATADIARQHGAIVVPVQHRQIAATRNSGARAARGDPLFFVDADTTLTPGVVQSALRRMDQGAVGGGALTRFEGSVPLYAKLLMLWLGFFMKLASLSGGAFMFCTREAFDAVGGFDEKLFGAEDAALSAALKKAGRFVVLDERPYTSGRRVRKLAGLQTLTLLLRIAFLPSNLTRRSSVEKVWYNSDRTGDDRADCTLFDRISNGLALVILSVLITLPLWVVPWPQSLLDGPLGYLRAGAKVIIAHISLVLWPCTWLLSRTFLQQKRWLERLKLIALIAVSLFIAARATLKVCALWSGLIHWLLR